ncbi:MAG: hypothetical protein M3336_16090 [Chloroflexota bacterium]|nr:hypothetical protein [Chloroflexota bacterium]
MRRVRWLSFGITLAVLLPTMASAQAGRSFRDSWIWGAKTGLMSFSTTTSKNVAAPMIGAEWLITRSRAALYVSIDQAFFNETVGLFDPTAGTDRTVQIGDMRRTSVALLAFPTRVRSVRPYGGIGLALNIIQDVSVRVAPGDSSDLRAFARQVLDEKDRAAVLLMGGVQGRVGRVSVFGQGTLMPARQRFLLNDRATFFLETGVRWNFGSSVERPQ